MSLRSFVYLAALGLLGTALPAQAGEPGPQAPFVTRTYQIADLLVPIGNGGGPVPPTKEGDLIELIVSAVRSRTWEGHGGAGTIAYHPLTMALVVNQTAEAHAEIGDLLKALRREQDQQVVLEMRIVSVSEACYENLALAFGEIEAKAGAAMPAVSFLKGERGLKHFMEALQEDAASNIMQAPKLTALNGQRAVVNAIDRQAYVTGVDVVRTPREETVAPREEVFEVGLKFAVRPIIAADRRSVALDLDLNLTSLDSEKVPLFPVTTSISPRFPDGGAGAPGAPVAFTQFIQQPNFTTLSAKKKFCVPEGGTVVLHLGKRMQEVRHEEAPPVLSKVPYLNRLFKTVGYSRSTEHVLCLVTARIVVEEQEEEVKKVASSQELVQASYVEPPVAAHVLAQAVAQAPTFAPTPTPTRAPTPTQTLTLRPVPKDTTPTKVRHARSRAIKLRYTLEDVGPSAVKTVEVWETRDALIWRRLPEDASPKGACTVEVKGEGRYGYLLVPRSGAGLARQAPRGGELPQLWVEVDETKPVVNLYRLEVGRGPDAGKFTVCWTASDAHLRASPIAIKYSTAPTGPWKEVPGMGKLPNVSPRTVSSEGLPPECYLRVEATDEAGNVGVSQPPRR